MHGNTDAVNTFTNAVRCLYAFGADPDIKVHRGASAPLMKPAKHDPEIHGPDGLGGVEGLPDASHPEVAKRLEESSRAPNAIEGMAAAVRWGLENVEERGKLTIVSTGPMTNVALFVSVYRELLEGVEEFVFMGGGVGVGNRSATAGALACVFPDTKYANSNVTEYNILCDRTNHTVLRAQPRNLTPSS